MKIVIDAMGSDMAPAVEVEGAIQAVEEFGYDLILVGDEALVKAELDKRGGGRGQDIDNPFSGAHRDERAGGYFRQAKEEIVDSDGPGDAEEERGRRFCQRRKYRRRSLRRHSLSAASARHREAWDSDLYSDIDRDIGYNRCRS